MTTLKKTAARKAKRAQKTAAATSRSATKVLRSRWAETWKGLTKAEAQLEKRVKTLLKRNGLDTNEVGKALQDLGTRIQKERKKALKQVESRLGGLQARVAREGKALGKVVDDAVRGALVTLNIPTRREVIELTRKVDELSRKLDRPSKAMRRTRASRTSSSASSAA